MSEEHAAESRSAFLSAISAGEGSIDLAEAALQVAAEDDGLSMLKYILPLFVLLGSIDKHLNQ